MKNKLTEEQTEEKQRLKEGKGIYRDMCDITPPECRNAEGITGAIYLGGGMVILPSGEMKCTDPFL